MDAEQKNCVQERFDNYPPLVAAALGIIEEEFAHLEGVNELAERLEVSINHCIREFTKYVGIPPGKYLRLCRVEYAKVLLAQPDMTVSLAAGLSGFSDPNYFTKVFRKTVGVLPSVYAAAHRNRVEMSRQLDEIYL